MSTVVEFEIVVRHERDMPLEKHQRRFYKEKYKEKLTCPEILKDKEQADEWLQTQISDLMDERGWDVVNDFKVLKVVPESKYVLPTEVSVTIHKEIQLTDRNTTYDENTGIVHIQGIGSLTEFNLVDFAKTVIGNNKAIIIDNKEETLYINDDNGNQVMYIAPRTNYTPICTNTLMIYDSKEDAEAEERWKKLMLQKITDAETQEELDMIEMMRYKKFYKGFVNYYNPNHIGIVWHGFTVSMNLERLVNYILNKKYDILSGNVIDIKKLLL